MNLVGIDISIDSTAVSILREEELIICSFSTLKRNNTWVKKTMDVIDYEFISYTYKEIQNYTEGEIMKLREYDHVTDLIYNKILGNINKKEGVLICLEGYSYGLKGNSIIDIVSFSTMLRLKLLNIPKLEKMIIVPPTVVKSHMCEMSYGYTITKSGKKIINKNPNGIAGGKFDKRDMLIALFNMNLDDKLSKLLNKYKNDILKLKSIPKPLDDILDSTELCYIIQK